jgi:flagellin FlaB
MNLILKKKYHTSRGIIGMEAAIVLIAFVIIAGALGFVLLNMGFSASQKAKSSITSSLGEASSGITISGKIIGESDGGGRLDAVMIPIKITAGGESVDLSDTRALVSYLGGTIEFDDIYDTGCTLAGGANTEHANATTAWIDATGPCIDASPISGAPTRTNAIIYWAISNESPTPNSILDPGEHAVLSIGWSQAPEQRPQELEKIKIELVLSGGATLTIERAIPNISNSIIDLG